jgi:hypothetical protein
MKEVGSVEVKHVGKTTLLVVTEERGFIHINGQYLPVSHNVEDSIRWIMKISSHLHIITTYFASEPKSSKFTKSTFLRSYWEDIAAESIIIAASVLVSNMSDDRSDPDSVS